jgi:ubiquinone/menaquinone biosynthesis C-methylase UbiE
MAAPLRFAQLFFRTHPTGVLRCNNTRRATPILSVTPMHTPTAPAYVRLEDELDLMADMLPLAGARLIELGCGAARLAAGLVQRFAGASVLGLEIDERQMAKNLAAPATPGLTFVNAPAQAIPQRDASFDGALMLKSLHHVPLAVMDLALAEVARVLKPDGWLYASEPVYEGPLNEVVRLYNDEGVVRAAAQAALDRAVHSGVWLQSDERWFESTVRFADFADFERRMMQATYSTHQVDAALLAQVQARFEAQQAAQGGVFTRPMRVRLLRKTN